MSKYARKTLNIHMGDYAFWFFYLVDFGGWFTLLELYLGCVYKCIIYDILFPLISVYYFIFGSVPIHLMNLTKEYFLDNNVWVVVVKFSFMNLWQFVSAAMETMKQEIKTLDGKINSLSNLLHGYSKVVGEPSCANSLISIHDHLKRRECCRLICQDLQVFLLFAVIFVYTLNYFA